MIAENIWHRMSWLCIVAAVTAGCATTDKKPRVAETSQHADEYADEIYQFDPVPVVQVGASELEPVAPRNATELLEEAMHAFELANEAQEAGNKEIAFAQYTLMMEMLLESDLDPTVFYELRDQFSDILQRTSHLARTYDRLQPNEWNQEIMELARRSELEFPNPLNDRVLAEIQAIQRTYPRSFQSGLNRSGKYMPYIIAEFEKAGLPTDLVWLAMVESQFTPKIDSRVGAGGMWQFMSSTGKRYGLSRNHYVDERYDWKKSTQAAITYLSELYEIFGGSWPLAVSAYNMGEGGLERAITSNGGERNLWRLIENPPAANRIRRETKKFYAKLLASSIVAQNPERYGFTNTPMPEERTTTIQVKGAYSLEDIDRKVGLARGTIAALNPQLISQITSPIATVSLQVPADMRTQVASAIEGMEQLQPSTHIVRKGETLSQIASLHRVSSRELQNANNIRSPRSLQIGQRLVIPGRTGASSGGSVNATTDPKGRKAYRVAKGDSLSRISSKFKVSVASLQQWNALGGSTQIHVGDNLYVAPSVLPTAEAAEVSNTVAAKSTANTTYVVQAGDSASSIAKKYRVSTQNLLQWNGLKSRSILHVGDVLHLRANTAIASAQPSTHVVRSGQNPSTIAKRYGLKLNDLYKLNKWNKDPVLQVGQKIVVAQ